MSTTTTGPATYLSIQDIKQFTDRYNQALTQLTKTEADSKSLKEIAASNLRVAELLQGFLSSIRSNSQASSTDSNSVLVSYDELRMLETEAQLRLIRAEAAQQAEVFDLGSVLVSSLDQNALQAELRREVARLNNESSADDDTASDESREERNPDKVDLDKSDGLYTILDTQQAIGIRDLIGYSKEATDLLNLTRDIRFVSRGLNETRSSENNRPIAIILYGPPGTGKTTSAQAVAKELGYTYMYVNAENVTSMWAGGTQKNIAKLFRRARIAASRFKRKTLLLIDEVDGLLKNRQKAANMTAEEYSRITTFLQMLTPPIGVDNSQIVCMFTTNNLENLDTAFVNRARQSIFLGYILQPADRGKLFFQLLNPYVDATTDEWTQLGTHYAEFVPRDVVNLSSLARSAVAGKYEKTNRQTGQSVVIDISKNPNLLLSSRELYELAQNMMPATPVERFFSYEPPPRYVSDWLSANQQAPERVRSVFQQEMARTQ